MAMEKILWNLTSLAQKVADARGGIGDLPPFGRGQDLDAIAGREDHPFAYGVAIDQLAERFGTCLFGEGEALAHFDWRCAMVESDKYDRHKGDQRSNLTINYFSRPSTERPQSPFQKT